MKKILILLFVLLVGIGNTRADEGMWLLNMLHKNYAQMKAQGFRLTPEDIYNVKKASIKDAVVIFGGFCTGEIVSNQGLILTNHHCGYGAIQSHSSVEHNYLKYGFWAKTKADELPNPGLYVSFLQSISDVTDEVLAGVTDQMNETERQKIISENIKKINKRDSKKHKGYIVRVRSFFNGNAYYELVYQKYNDVRLVGTPPESIGKFGYDTDNWMYPRHTGDFSVFRVYADKNNKPAEYSKDNVPLKPKYHLKVSLKGYTKGSFAMILGYPGHTDRYMTSFGVLETMNIINPNRIKIRGIRQDIIMKDMLASDEIRIKYSSKYARSSNYWKYSIGQNKGLKRLHVVEKKQTIEKKFTDWVNQDAKRQAKYSEALNLIKNAYEGRAKYINATQYLSECFLRGIEVYGFAGRFIRFNDALKNNNKKQIAAMKENLKKTAEGFFKDYNAPTDKKVAAAMLKLFTDDMQKDMYPAEIKNIADKYSGNYDKYADYLFANSIFADKDKLMKFLDNPTSDVLEKDPAFKAIVSIRKKLNELRGESEKFTESLNRGRRLFLAGLMEMQPDKNFYPDANFTMRLTYGNVLPYSPKDAVEYNYFTTLKGVMEKEDPNNFEFVVDPKLKELYQKKDYGRYADKDGTMHVCFLTNNDITGGNSGSPVLDGDGNLIGLAFDGNWEAMSGDIAFEPDLQRTIVVDVRYVLFVMDKLGGAKHLVDEMTIVE